MLILSILIVNWSIWIIKLHLWYFVTFGVAYYPVSETMVFTICKKFLENLVGKKMGHDFLGRSGGLFWSNGTSEKVILFFEFHFLKAVFDTSLGVRNRFSVDRADLYTDMVNAIFPCPIFACHLPKPWTDRFARVDGKQPILTTVPEVFLPFML